MKRVTVWVLLTALVFALVPFAGAEDAAAEETVLGGILVLEDPYTLISEDQGMYMVMGEERVLFVQSFRLSEMGLDGDAMRDALPDMKGMSANGTTYGDTIYEVNGFQAIPFTAVDGSSEIPGAMALQGDCVVYIYYFSNEGVEGWQSLLNALRLLDAAGDAEPAETAAAGKPELPEAWSAAGYYDALLLGEKDPDITLILTPYGYGRLTNSSSSVTFEYRETEDHSLIVLDTDAFKLAPVDEETVLLQSENANITFVRRGPVGGNQNITGKWKAISMVSKGVTYTTDNLAALGILMEFIAYENGAMDWHAVTNTNTWVAQGWGVDEKGLYLFNGDRVTLLQDEGELTLWYDSRNSIVFTFQGPAE